MGYRKEVRHSLDNLLHTGNNQPNRYRGYAGQDRAWTGEFERAKREMKRYYQPLDTPSIRLFDQFLREMKAADVNLVMVYPPEYLEGQVFVSNRAQIFSIYRHFARKYEIPFLDFSADSLSFRKELFYNTQHLNKAGAELFTESLIGKLR